MRAKIDKIKRKLNEVTKKFEAIRTERYELLRGIEGCVTEDDLLKLQSGFNNFCATESEFIKTPFQPRSATVVIN